MSGTSYTGADKSTFCTPAVENKLNSVAVVSSSFIVEAFALSSMDTSDREETDVMSKGKSCSREASAEEGSFVGAVIEARGSSKRAEREILVVSQLNGD